MADFPFALVGFDLDGTLLDTSGDLASALNHALALVGRPPVATSEVRALIGGGARAMLAKALRITGGALPDAEVDALHRDLVTHYAANIARETRPFPRCLAALDALAARGVALAVVTNKREALAVKLLRELALADRFVAILGGDSLGPGKGKPAPDLLLAMVARARLAWGARAAFVGDTSYDVGAAHAAGMPCAVFAGGFCDAPAAELGADAVFAHYDELAPALLSLAPA